MAADAPAGEELSALNVADRLVVAPGVTLDELAGFVGSRGTLTGRAVRTRRG
jgi:hypothetical protein